MTTKIGIIGGGASGTLLATNLLEHHENRALEIVLIEKSAEIGRGIAYGTAKDFHLLNVPAAQMSAFCDDGAHFLKWLATNGFSYHPTDFVPRKIYGRYLRETFERAVERKPENVSLKIINDTAVDATRENGETVILTEKNDKIAVDKIVLAFGNFLPPHVRTVNDDYQKSAKYTNNPWRADIPEIIEKSARVLIIGTGLTGIDVILSLFYHRHRGDIFALSTHGLFPTVHQKTAPYPSFQTEIEAVATVRERTKIVRRHIADSENWRAVIDSLRPFTQGLWQSFPPVEKRRFMRHLQRRWDVHRHRTPPECQQILDDLRGRNQLKTLRGRIKQIEINHENGFDVTFGKNEKVSVDWIINCTGSQSNYEKLNAPLVQNLLAKGEIKPDALKMGLDATADFALINRENQVSATFYTFATAHKGVLWECTAMPDIRAQAEKLAKILLGHPKSKI